MKAPTQHLSGDGVTYPASAGPFKHQRTPLRLVNQKSDIIVPEISHSIQQSSTTVKRIRK